jgi:aryl-alcohol dehydrogenase-like predicted oxidoreductase
MEFDYQSFFEQKQLGTTIWSPLLGGILTGKYNQELP